MNVLYLASEPRIELSAAAGHATHILKTIKGLEDKGHFVQRVIAGERTAARQAKNTFRKFKTRLPTAVSVALRDIYEIVHDRHFARHCHAICRENKFDFIYERATPYHRAGCELSKMLQIPWILEVNSPLEELITLHGCSPVLVPVASYIEKTTACKADAVVVGSAGMRRYLVNRGVSADKIFTIYPTADDVFFRPAHGRRELRRRLLVEHKVVVGFVGSMTLYQRAELLLQAADQVRRFSQDVHFLIVGHGKTMESLRSYVANEGLSDCVTFTGRVPYSEVPDYLSAMDICVIPHATWYGSPTKLFEYAASGKPVIAPSVEPIQELIRDGENGILTKPCDASDLGQKILMLAADSSLRTKLGSQLRFEIMRDHTWEKNTAKLIDVFESLRVHQE